MRYSRSFCTLAVLALAAGCEQAVAPAVQPPAPDPARYEVGTGYILTPAGKPFKITYQAIEGEACWQGDICLGPVGELAKTEEEALARKGSGASLGVYITNTAARWPRAVIPYVIGGDLPSTSRVTQAINDLHAKTGLKFVPRTNEANYVHIGRTTGPSRVSNIGRYGSTVQYMYLNDASPWQVAAHELGHVAGLAHEHQRCDRDSYVRILWQNVDPNLAGNFDKLCPAQGWTTTAHGYAPYDQNSIMHYGPTEFSHNGQPTIQMLDGSPITRLGERSGATPNDHRTLREMYPNNARFVGYQNVPTTMKAGQYYNVTVVMENNGQGWWRPEQAYRLGSQNPQDNSTWGTARAFLPGEIGPGHWAYITFQIRAPTTPGQYNFQWRIVKEWAYWFGEHSTNLVINVVP